MKKILFMFLFAIFTFNLGNIVFAQDTWTDLSNTIAENHIVNTWLENIELDTEIKEWIKEWFLWVMMPAALADSINPCAFAVMLILLAAILKKSKSKKKAMLAGILFALTIFVMYFLMGLGLLNAMASTDNTYVLKLVIWILWVLVWLANLKDYFFPDVWPRMEVPEAWKPNMQKITSSITSPIGAIWIWIIISLFLLPCTSGPYITILGYLSTETVARSWYMYLFIYNFIFILPMLVIVILVWTGTEKVEKLARFRKDNVNLLHLIVWILMLWLGLYVLMTM